MSDIVEKLRGFWGDVSNRDIVAAADEIERLREALQKISQHHMQAIAMDALRSDDRIRAALPKGAERE